VLKCTTSEVPSRATASSAAGIVAEVLITKRSPGMRNVAINLNELETNVRVER
jgi:hypothetical protein